MSAMTSLPGFYLLFAVQTGSLMTRGFGEDAFPTSDAGLTGPQFTSNLPSQVTFLNTDGLVLPCRAIGKPAPAVEWIYSSRSGDNGYANTEVMAATARRDLVSNIAQILTVFPNNSLWFHPFKESQYWSGVHASRLRCVAVNDLGAIVSTDVTVKAVIRNQYTVFNTRVDDVYVMRGSVAVLRCDINPPHLTDVITVMTWQRGSTNITNGGRFLQLTSRTLYIYNVTDEDAHFQYRCVTLNQVTGDVKYSDPASVYVIAPVTTKPTIADYTVGVVAEVGDTARLPCVASSYPEPSYSYTRDGGLAVELGGRYELNRGNLVIRLVEERDAGSYTCKAENSQGGAEITTTLSVRESLKASISPATQTVDAGEAAFLQCNIRGFPVDSVVWYKDGFPLPSDPRSHAGTSQGLREEGWAVIQNHTVLQVVDMQNTAQGVYQCFVGNKWETVQTVAEIRLGEASPKLANVPADQYLDPGENVTLTCTASGNPQPQVYWRLDGTPLLEYTHQLDNVSVSEITDEKGDLRSTLHISSVSVQLGGMYTCVANNSVGLELASSTVFVYGVPFIKPLSNVTVLANTVLQLECHVSGYPVKHIVWTTGDVELPHNHRHHVWPNGTLQITEVTKADAGLYTCTARNVQGQGMARSALVTVLDPPSIDSFHFGQKKAGDRVSVSCVVSRGDLPLQFVWLKDGGKIPSDLGIVIQHTGAFSSQLSIPTVSTLHSGNYTCLCHNKAAEDQTSDYLHVNVPPRWISEPYDTSLILGESTTIPCQSYGIPAPSISWTRASMEEKPGHYSPVFLDHGDNSTDNPHRPNHTTYCTEDGSLVVSRARKSDEGHYLCQATNDVGTALGKLISLTVHLPAYFDATIINKTVVKGDAISLECHARGDFPLTVTWSSTEPGVNLSSSRYLYSDKLYGNGRLTTLQILHSEPEDTATYICSAGNEYGEDTLQINLLVQDVPGSPESVRADSVTHSTASVSWRLTEDGNSRILYYILTYQPMNGFTGPISVEVPANATHTNLRYLRPAVMYHLVVSAENAIGRSNRSEQVIFTTKEIAPTGPPQNVQAFGISEQIIQLVWEPPKESLQNGKIQGYRVVYRHHSNHSEPFNSATKPSTNGSYEHMNLEGLEMFTQYEIQIQAYNSQGNGPLSDTVLEYTKEGVPSAAPESVQAIAMSSQDIYLVWSPPRLQALHGILQGYAVYYARVRQGQVEGELCSHTSEVKTVLRGLDKYSVYSLQVAAYTRVGEGVRSDPVLVQTNQDVPRAPAAVKCIPVNSSAILVSWQEPDHTNGVLTHYTLYITAVNQSVESEEVVLAPLEQSYLLTNVTAGVNYSFRLSASTVVGEGLTTQVQHVTITDKVPARIASFSSTHHTVTHTDVYLPCFAVGLPQPVINWYPQQPLMVDMDSSQCKILSNGTLWLKNVTRHNQGKYRCVAENEYGSDEVEHSVVTLEPPSKPVLFLLGRLSSLLEVGWHLTEDPDVRITGYMLMFSSDDVNWDVIEFSSKAVNYTIHNLNCGTSYYVKIKAKTRIGDSPFSDTKQMHTTGRVPLLPSTESLLQHVNSTFAMLNLSSWQTFGCPIIAFAVEVQLIGEDGWDSARTDIPSNTTLYRLDLQPETWYLVRVTARSEPGPSVTVFKFATKSYFGSTLGPLGDPLAGTSPESPSARLYYLVIGVTASLLLLSVIVVWLALHCWHRTQFPYRGQNMTSGFKRDGTITDMSLLPENDKEMDMSVISSSEDCPGRASQYSRTPTRTLNVSALVCRSKNTAASRPPAVHNRRSHVSYSGSEESFQSEKDGQIVPYATFAPTKLPVNKPADESTPLTMEETDLKPSHPLTVEYVNTKKTGHTENHYLSPLPTTSVKVSASTEDERKPLMT